MSAVTEREWATRILAERQRIERQRAWDETLSTRKECQVAYVDWTGKEWQGMRPQTAEEWRYGDDLPYRWRLRDRLIVGAIIGAGCAMWLWLTWRYFERLTR